MGLYTSKIMTSGLLQEAGYPETLGSFFAISKRLPGVEFNGMAASQYVIAKSSDGINWEQAGPLTSNVYNSIADSRTKRITVAVGNGCFMYSRNGVDWIEKTITGNLNDVAWSESLGLFVAVGENKAYSSTDGINWTQRSLPNTNTFTRVIFSTRTNLFMALSGPETGGFIYSSNGTSWAAGPNTYAGWVGIADYSIYTYRIKSTFGGSPDPEIALAANPTTSWTYRFTDIPGNDWINLRTAGSRTYALASDSIISYALGLTSWQTPYRLEGGTTSSFYNTDITYSPSLNRYVISMHKLNINNSSLNQSGFYYSTNGTSFTPATVTAAMKFLTWQKVIWIN